MDGASRTCLWGGAALGFGMSGLLDVAIFHAILQWHHLVMDVEPAMRLRIDGWLMLALLGASAAGVLLLWRGARGSPQRGGGTLAWGGALLGAAAFNGGDILLDHLALGLHRLHPAADTWLPELGWLALSLALGAGGALLVRRGALRARSQA